MEVLMDDNRLVFKPRIVFKDRSSFQKNGLRSILSDFQPCTDPNKAEQIGKPNSP